MIPPAFRWIIARRLARERPRTLLTLLGVALGVGVFVAVRLASTSALASFSGTVDAVAGKANLELASGTEGFDERAFTLARSVAGVRAAAPVVQVDALARPGAPAPPGRAGRAGTATSGAGAAVPAGAGRRHGSAANAPDEPRARSLYPDQVLVIGVDSFSEGPFQRFLAWDEPDSLPAEGSRALEFLSDPRAAAITRTLAARHGLGLGDSLTVLSSGRPLVLHVRAILESPALQHAYGGNVVVVDIATAQEGFNRLGRLDRVDLIVEPTRLDAVALELRRRLPADILVEAPAARSRQVENMVRAFELNLTALSFIALFVASFLVLNAVSMSVTRRRGEIGVLRAVGMTRRQVAAMFVGEGATFGVVGAGLGLVLGTLLARAALGAVSSTLSDLYLVYQARTLHPDASSYAIAGGLGVAVAVLAALVPALEASRTRPSSAMREGADVVVPRAALRAWTLAGLVLLGSAALIAAWTVRERRPWGGFLSAFVTVIAGSALAPGFTLALETLLGRPLRRLFGIEGALATGFLRVSVARTSVVVAALMVSVGMWVALSVMVGSFRRTVSTWVNQTIRGDLYVEPVGHRLNLSSTVLPDALVDSTRALPDVAAIVTYRGARIVYGGRPAFAAGIDFDVQRRFGRLSFARGSGPEILRRALRRSEVIVSESFARHHRLAPGDSITLGGGEGRPPAARAPPARAAAITGQAAGTRLRVAGVFYDYSTDAGVVMMDRGLYSRLWGSRTESMAVYLRPGSDPDAVRERIIGLAGPELLLSVMPSRALRARALEVFDQTFRITYALQAIAILVAVLGVIGTLTALVLQRRREIGVLRAAGARRGQVIEIVMLESGLLGLIGALLGCLAGVVLALILVHVINTQYFGWTIRVRFDPGVFASAVLVMTAAATLAGVSPARLAAGRLAAEALREE